MTLLLVLAVTALFCAPFLGADIGVGAAMGLAGGMMGGRSQKRDRVEMEKARTKNIKRMRELWKKARAESAGQFRAAEGQIRANQLAGLGNIQAAMAGNPLMTGTLGLQARRGLTMDTNRSLQQLASLKSSVGYQQMQDRIALQNMTKWGDVDISGQGEAMGKFYGELGNVLFGDKTFGDIF